MNEVVMVMVVKLVAGDGAHFKCIFRSARTSCTTFGWFVRPVRPSRKKNLDHLYTGIYAL